MQSKLVAIILLVLAAVIAVGFYSLSGRTEPFYLLGEILGPAAIISGIFWISRSKVAYLNRIAIALLVAVVLTVARNYDEVRAGYEQRQAEQVLKTITDPSKIVELANAHPNNRVLKIMSIVWPRGTATRTQIAGLLGEAAALPPSTSKPLYSMTAGEMAEARQGLAAALDKLASLKTQVPQLYDAEYAAASAEMAKLDSPDMTKQALAGLQDRMAGDKDYYQRLISAYEEFYGDLAAQAEYLKANGGQYDAASKSVLFKDQAGVDGWNVTVQKAQDSLKKLQAFDAEAAKLNQNQSQLFNELQGN
jgi:hypothetical protein